MGLMFVLVALPVAMATPSPHSIQKRGVPIGPMPYGTEEAANAAINQISASGRIAEWSASSAVGDAVGRDYGQRVGITDQFVARFTVPVTKEGVGEMFDTIANNQKASDISSALASNRGVIDKAASNAASSNYDQAYQAEQLGYNRQGSAGRGHYGGGGGGSGGGGYGGGGSVYY